MLRKFVHRKKTHRRKNQLQQWLPRSAHRNAMSDTLLTRSAGGRAERNEQQSPRAPPFWECPRSLCARNFVFFPITIMRRRWLTNRVPSYRTEKLVNGITFECTRGLIQCVGPESRAMGNCQTGGRVSEVRGFGGTALQRRARVIVRTSDSK